MKSQFSFFLCYLLNAIQAVNISERTETGMNNGIGPVCASRAKLLHLVYLISLDSMYAKGK